MNILFTIRDLHSGGACMLLSYLLPELKAGDHKVYLVYYAANNDMKTTFQSKGIPVRRIPYSGKKDFISALYRTYRFIRDHRVDLVHSNLLLDRLISGLAAKFAGVPAISSIHYSIQAGQERYPSVFQKYTRRALDRLLAATIDRYVAVSLAAADAWLDRHPGRQNKVRVIHSGISEQNRDGESSVDLSDRFDRFDKILLTACRLDEIKGLDRLIRVFDRISNHYSKTALIILGDGGYRTALESMVREHHLEDRVFIMGFREQVGEYMKIADFYINTSYAEALGLSILEAMQCGLPTLGSKVGGIPEIIRDGINGFLIDFDDEEEAARRIIEFLSMEQGKYIQLRKQTKQEFNDYFTVERYADELLNVYEEL